MRRVRRETGLDKIPRNFIAYVIMSFALIFLVKIMSENIKKPPVQNARENNLQIIAKAICKYTIENDNKLPRRLSDLYPKYCINLKFFNPPGYKIIKSPNEIEINSVYRLNPDIPERLDDIYLRNSLIILTDRTQHSERVPNMIINGNLEVLPFTKQSMALLGLTYKNVLLEKKEIDENQDGKTDEAQYSHGNKIIYTVKKSYNNDGRLFRETWYDAKGEITSDFGPAFRMYNYNSEGRLTRVTNHLPKGEPFESFGVAKIIYKYEKEVIKEYYYNKDGILITALSKSNDINN